MATFKVVKRVKGKLRGKTEITIKDVFTIGSSPACDKALLDELIEPRHAAIEYVNGAFVIKDLNSTAGVLHNYIFVKGSATLEDADIVDIGSHQFSVSLGKTDELMLIHENPPALSALYRKSDKATVRPALLYWLLAILCASVLPLIGYCGAGEYFWQPDSLHASHLNAACTQCHTPLKGIDAEKCSKCHQREGYDSLHPLPLVQVPCESCHPDHKGQDASIIAIGLFRQDDWCRSCHSEFHEDVPAAIINTTTIAKTRTFSHAAHQKDKNSDCGDCHKSSLQEKRDFDEITYESCLACHEERKVGEHGKRKLCLSCHPGNDEGLEMSRQLLLHKEKRQKFLQKITIGGVHQLAGENCRKCHPGKHVAIEERSISNFMHDEFHVSNKFSQNDCLQCHKSVLGDSPQKWEGVENCRKCHESEQGLTIDTVEKSSAKLEFSHAKHLDAMNANEERKPLFEKGCQACHQLRDEKFSIVAAKGCADCHQNHQEYGEKYRELPRCSYCHAEIYKNPNLLTASRLGKNHTKFSHKKSHKNFSCRQCHFEMEKTTFTSPLLLNRKLCNNCHENQEEKDKPCYTCHGYHSFFSKQR